LIRFFGAIGYRKTPQARRLERREPARNRLRFYAIPVTRTLFDRWAVVREWEGHIDL
jgi:predicted DNA-binding WGR domain protein